MKSTKVKSTKNIVVPSIQVVGEKDHALKVLFDGSETDLPVIKSIGYMRLPDMNTYIAYTITSQGREIISIEVEEPNIRPIAEESAKIAFVNSFCGDE